MLIPVTPKVFEKVRALALASEVKRFPEIGELFEAHDTGEVGGADEIDEEDRNVKRPAVASTPIQGVLLRLRHRCLLR